MSIAEGISGIFEDPSLLNRTNTWGQMQQYSTGIAINSDGFTSAPGVISPHNPLAMTWGQNISSMGVDIYGNLEPINPSGMAVGSQWGVFGGGSYKDIYVFSVYQYENTWQFAAAGKVNGITVGTTPSSANPAITSGTVYQNTSTSYQTLYIPVYASTAGTAGTAAFALGTTDTPSTIFTQYVSGDTSSTSQEVMTVCIPPQWYYAVTVTGATIGTVTQLQE